MSLGIQRWDFCPHGCKVAAAHRSMVSVSQSGRRGRERGKGFKVKRDVGHS